MENSPLSKLPPELRNRVYDMVLLTDSSILVGDRADQPWKLPGLLQVCRHIRQEALATYYIRNTFTISQKPAIIVVKVDAELVMENSPLRKLSSELRNQIYENALIQPIPVQATPAMVTGSPLSFAPPIWTPPALLQTCRQIAQEATTIYYGGNSFSAASTEIADCNVVLLGKWLFGLSEYQRSQIRCVLVRACAFRGRDGLAEALIRNCRRHLNRKGVAIDESSITILA